MNLFLQLKFGREGGGGRGAFISMLQQFVIVIFYFGHIEIYTISVALSLDSFICVSMPPFLDPWSISGEK